MKTVQNYSLYIPNTIFRNAFSLAGTITNREEKWGGRWGSNPRPQESQSQINPSNNKALVKYFGISPIKKWAVSVCFVVDRLLYIPKVSAPNIPKEHLVRSHIPDPRFIPIKQHLTHPKILIDFHPFKPVYAGFSDVLANLLERVLP